MNQPEAHWFLNWQAFFCFILLQIRITKTTSVNSEVPCLPPYCHSHLSFIMYEAGKY